MKGREGQLLAPMEHRPRFLYVARCRNYVDENVGTTCTTRHWREGGVELRDLCSLGSL